MKCQLGRLFAHDVRSRPQEDKRGAEGTMGEGKGLSAEA